MGNPLAEPVLLGEPLEAAFAELRQASREAPWPTLDERRQRLARLADMLLARQDAIADAISADFGHRSPMETQLAELFPSLEGIRHARSRLKRWMRPQRRGVSIWFRPGRNRVLPQPLGVVGIVVPWNYPLFLAIGPLVSALAAGNRAMIKMSEFTPRTGALLAECLEQALGRDVVRVFNGPVELAQHFCKLPFDHLLFTGSTPVGRQVMRAAADNLTPVTLELGGKSPVLVAPDADLARAAKSIVGGKLLNAGQTCVAPDYVLVPRRQRQTLIEALSAAAAKLYPHLAENADYSAIVNQRHYERLLGWVEEARAAGAQVLAVNPRAESLASVRKVPLTLVWQCPDETQLMREELFGPVLPIVEYDDLAQAIDYINQRPRPLALYLFSDDARVQETVLQRTVSGGVVINETMLHVIQDDLPFGGVGASGMGHYHGYEGFLSFSKLKPIYRQPRLNTRGFLLPPYGALARWLMKMMVR
ncbi:coniferyl aldehyde dehydrogenase [Paludibacterium purpuratum]|uniref:Aldehyde dehydrogenase n=1 Tax=Paludibacterium purpuratum TaxID=1144873 RepID=A0A4R7B135_9NEIS|nr:coniferyl aldehyde dehydrogenase [Paludibacterium purpuratum]TDR73026.1 aldehyde dehydrogenase (NAD+)/coniferyl-aldehyde dehydrogenase [Paludibacterium purpuratum]